jgi:hypothetical protein
MLHSAQNINKFFGKKPNVILLMIILSLLPVLKSCNNDEINTKVDEGIIEYEISYLNTGNHFPVQLLPKIMKMEFNRNFTSYTIEDRLGLFVISNIIDLKDRKHVTLLKVFDKKYAYSGGKKEPPILFDASVKYDVNYIDDTSRIIGILCNKALINEKNTDDNFDVFYTNQVGINNPNINTPYERIDGMLMNFKLRLKSLDMQLKAKKIDIKEIDNKQFEIPSDYKFISRNKMEEILTTLLP